MQLMVETGTRGGIGQSVKRHVIANMSNAKNLVYDSNKTYYVVNRF